MNVEIKVIWHKQAREALRKTAAYIRKNYGLKVRENFRNEVNQVQTLLTRNPYMVTKSRYWPIVPSNIGVLSSIS